MFEFRHLDKTYRIYFHHARPVTTAGDLKGITYANLAYKNGNDTFVHLSCCLARCSSNDQFCRATGRRVALQRLMREWPVTAGDKVLRTRVWAEYARCHRDGKPIIEHLAKEYDDSIAEMRKELGT